MMDIEMTIMELWVMWIKHPWVHWFDVFTGAEKLRWLHVWDVFWAPILFYIFVMIPFR